MNQIETGGETVPPGEARDNTTLSKLEGKIVRIRGEDLPKRSPERLAEIAAKEDDDSDIDYSDIPQFPGAERLYRNASGKLSKRKPS